MESKETVMSVEVIRDMLAWCCVINYGILIVWSVLLFLLPHEWFYNWGKLFHITKEQLDRVNLPLLGIYKLVVLVFNLVPYLALRIVG
jgi:hypothetical protein